MVANCGASILLLDLVVEPLRNRHACGARRQGSDDLLARVIPILEAARGQVVRAVNHAMVSAYWHLGREVVEAIQQGDERAAYGKAVVDRLARELTDRYGKGFSATNLGYFRQSTWLTEIEFPTHWVGNRSGQSYPTRLRGNQVPRSILV